MAARVNAHVHVTSGDGIKRAWLQPGDRVPSWARVDDRLLETGAGTAEENPEPPTVQVPPRVGRGSGLEAWLQFAEAHDVGVDSGMSRDDVIAACVAAGVIDSEG